MTRPRLRGRAARLTLALTAFAAALAPLAVVAPTTQAATCTMRNTTDSFAGRALDYHYWVNTPAKGTPVKTDEYVDRGPVGTGPVTVSFYTCKQSDGTWKLHSAHIDENYADLVVSETYVNGRKRVTAEPQSGRYGYGVFVRRVRAGSIAVAPVRCAQEPLKLSPLRVLDGLRELPIPTPQRYVVGSFILDVLLPDTEDEKKYLCGRIDDVARIPIKIGPKGAVWFDIPENDRRYIGEYQSSHLDDRCNYQAYLDCRRYDRSVMWVINR